MLTDSPLRGQGRFQVGKITVVSFLFFLPKKKTNICDVVALMEEERTTQKAWNTTTIS